jgi:hypothetical protein
MVGCILHSGAQTHKRNDMMTQLAMLDEEKEDREIPPAFAQGYGLASDSARNDTARWRNAGSTLGRMILAS